MADAEAFLKKWKAAGRGDRDALVAEDATFLSPAFWGPKQGKEYVLTVLGQVGGGTEDFEIVNEWVQDDRIIFEFTARLGDVGMKGVDIITINDDGKLQQLEVLIRPINALMAMAEHVKTAFKQPDVPE
ncbi:MAG: nuclear transport factor 2 family protein [Alphaproteobacteria bacterium]